MCVVESELDFAACLFLGDGDADDGEEFEVVLEAELTEAFPDGFAGFVGYLAAYSLDEAVEAFLQEGLQEWFVEHVVGEVHRGVGTAGYLYSCAGYRE